MKKGFLIITVIILLFLAGCRGGGRAGTEPSGRDYRVGTQGLVFNFASNTPSRFYENQREVKMIAEVKNKGAYPQPDESASLYGHVWVYGFDKNILSLDPEEYLLDDEALEGINQFNPEGGYQNIILSGTIFGLPEGTPVYRPTVILTMTYKYKTVASPEICVDPFPYETEIRDKVCSITDYTQPTSGSTATTKRGVIRMTSNQGAPVAVTNVIEDATQDYLLFRIEIQNVGNGFVIHEGDIDKDPNQGYDYDSLNEVRLADVSVGNQPMDDCRPYIGDYIKLINGRGSVTCKFSLAGIDSVYTSPLNIKLEYGYSSSVKKDIEIIEEI